jgi:hypothetical protein
MAGLKAQQWNIGGVIKDVGMDRELVGELSSLDATENVTKRAGESLILANRQ